MRKHWDDEIWEDNDDIYDDPAIDPLLRVPCREKYNPQADVYVSKQHKRYIVEYPAKHKEYSLPNIHAVQIFLKDAKKQGLKIDWEGTMKSNPYTQALHEHFTPQQITKMKKSIVLAAHQGWDKSKIAAKLESAYGLNTRFSHWLVTNAVPKVLANPKRLQKKYAKIGKEYSTIMQKKYKGKLTIADTKKLTRLSRALKNPVEIYDNVLEIRAQKGEKSLWPKELFKHKFKGKSKAKVLGNPDGSLTIKSANGTRLWKKFDYK